jgi:hypothetical protein
MGSILSSMAFWIEKGFLLPMFIFSYVHFSYAQNEDLKLNDYVNQRRNYTLNENEFLIVKGSIAELRRDTGIEFSSPLMAGYCIVKLIPGQLIPYKFRILGSANNYWKLSPAMRGMSLHKEAIYFSKTNSNNFIISTYSADSLLKFLKEEKLNAIKLPDNGKSFKIELRDEKTFRKVLDCGLVTFIDLQRSPAEEESLISFHDLSVNGINFVHHKFPHLNGESLNVSVREKTIEKDDIDFIGRILPSPLENPLISFHANQMATIIAGAGNSSPDSKGIAWASSISSASFVSPFPDPLQYFQEHQIFVQNHSYGFGIENYYGAEANAFDLQTNENAKLIHVFSSGNEGEQSPTSGLYSGVNGFANLTGNMKMAKNAIVVGGHYQDYSIDTRNSRGPSFDGRIKPEIIAYGPEGTSDAAAYVSGIALLMQHAYQKNYGELPASSLVKTVLAVTADDVAGKGIDFVSGFGRVNAIKAIELVANNLFFESTVEQSGQESFNLTVPENINQLRVALGWNDPAAEAGASEALINDLDLTVEEMNSSTVFEPWVLNSFPHADSLSKAPKRKRDNLNNIELITIDNPPAGEYKINVSPFDIIGPQKFHLAYWLDTANVFFWSYPSGSEVSASEKECFLRWQTTYTETGNVFASINGNDFELISEDIETTKGFISWSIPTGVTSVVFKMQIQDKEFVSDTLFSAPVVSYDVGFNCEDEAMLSWHKDDDVDKYILYNLKEKYMEPILISNDTSFTFSPSLLSRYFALAPLYNGKEGKRGLTYDYTQLGVKCFYKNFSAQLGVDNHAALSISLSTTLNVEKIQFEKNTNGIYENIGEAIVNEDLIYGFNDELNPGIHKYRAVIALKNGNLIYTEEATLIYTDENTYGVFPNPVVQGEEHLQILSDGKELKMELFDTTGKFVLSQEIFGSLFQFPLISLPSGLYLYRFIRNNKIVFNGRLILN